jgi:hypothetical protein
MSDRRHGADDGNEEDVRRKLGKELEEGSSRQPPTNSRQYHSEIASISQTTQLVQPLRAPSNSAKLCLLCWSDSKLSLEEPILYPERK